MVRLLRFLLQCRFCGWRRRIFLGATILLFEGVLGGDMGVQSASAVGAGLKIEGEAFGEGVLSPR
jgi:hypothetical protein